MVPDQVFSELPPFPDVSDSDNDDNKSVIYTIAPRMGLVQHSSVTYDIYNVCRTISEV